jgi:uncharacterized membrane protein YdbT with pleckstrin-like domain
MWEEAEYHFYGQRIDERVVLVRNQHPMVLLIPVLIDLALFAVMLLLVGALPDPFKKYVLFLFGAGILIHVIFYVYGYRNSMCILSSQRILNIIQRGFFNKQINEAELSRIQDVATNVSGILQTMFGFGNVTIRTASETTLVLRNIKSPYDVQQAIARAMNSKDIKGNQES